MHFFHVLVPHHTMYGELLVIVKISNPGFFSSPSYYVWGTLEIVQNFDIRFLADLHVLGSGESKKHKISMVSGCSLVSVCVC